MLKQLMNSYKVYRWSRLLRLKDHERVFDRLYHSLNGFALSREAREHHDAFEYTYGEIDFCSFIALLSLAHPHAETQFYDLGSGTGKAVLACAMVYGVSRSCGIEYFEALHTAAVKQKEILLQNDRYTEKAQYIHLVHGDFLQSDLRAATLIFINATAFVGPIWEQLTQKLATEASAATIITVSKKLASSVFELTQQVKVRMSWGIATAYLYAAADG